MNSDQDSAKEVVQESIVSIWQKLKIVRSAEVSKKRNFKVVINKNCHRLIKEYWK